MQDDHPIEYPPEYAERSARVLNQALRIPAYAHWHALDPGPCAPPDARYRALPALTKSWMGARGPEAFVPRGRSLQRGIQRGDVELVTTSGTTAEKVTNVWHQPYWNASERASWALNAHTARLRLGKHREAILTSPYCTGIPSERADVPMRVRRDGRFLYLNEIADARRWTRGLFDRMVEELNVFEPEVLEANPSMLAILARHVTRTGASIRMPGVVILTYEWPSRIQLRLIREAFSCPVASSYGSTETGYVFMECEAGKYHQNSDFCRVDFLPLQRRHGGPRIGRILVTPFGNPWYRIIRFCVGDLVRVSASAQCPCGRRGGLILDNLEGRARDVTFTTQGRAVTINRLDRSMARIEGIDGYQVEQSDRGTYCVRIVTERSRQAAVGGQVRKTLGNLYGKGARIGVTFARGLIPEPSGKIRLAKHRDSRDPDMLLADPLPEAAS